MRDNFVKYQEDGVLPHQTTDLQNMPRKRPQRLPKLCYDNSMLVITVLELEWPINGVSRNVGSCVIVVNCMGGMADGEQ
jgi:hypothetical protein